MLPQFLAEIFRLPYLGLGGDDVDLVDSSQWASVDAERSGDEKQTGSQLLQEHDALSLVDAGDEDQHGARGDGRTQFAAFKKENVRSHSDDNFGSFEIQ